jgi:hypothetical protein
LTVRWYDALPAGFARILLTTEAGLGSEEAADAVSARPAGSGDRLPGGLRESAAL